MGKISEGLLQWRRKQERGAIMQPATFKKIEAAARKRGADNPKAVAGASYWRSARAKFKGRKVS